MPHKHSQSDFLVAFTGNEVERVNTREVVRGREKILKLMKRLFTYK